MKNKFTVGDLVKTAGVQAEDEDLYGMLVAIQVNADYRYDNDGNDCQSIIVIDKDII